MLYLSCLQLAAHLACARSVDHTTHVYGDSGYPEATSLFLLLRFDRPCLLRLVRLCSIYPYYARAAATRHPPLTTLI
jgi:hypothetical protein